MEIRITKAKINTDALLVAQAAAWNSSLDQTVETYNLGYTLVRTDLEIMDEIHDFEDLPMMLEALDVPPDFISRLRLSMMRIITGTPSAHKATVDAARELVKVLREKIALIYQLLSLTRSELGREITAADYEFERKYRQLML